jgi:hypothetical protein
MPETTTIGAGAAPAPTPAATATAAAAAAATPTTAAALISAIAAESNEELAVGMELDRVEMSAAQGRYLLRLGEFDRRQAFRQEGATSVEAWSAERFGVSQSTARVDAHVAEKAQDLPHLVGSLCEGEISFDKVRVLADVATPETEQGLCEQAQERSVRELAEVARTIAARARSASVSPSRCEQDGRYLRLHDEQRTVSLQLPTEAYAQTKACIDAWAQTVPVEEGTEVPLDQRRCDGFMAMVDSAGSGSTGSGSTGSGSSGSGSSGSGNGAGTPNPFFVVAHVPLEALVDEAGQTSELAGELEHGGLIDVETVQRIACDATVVVALDDKLGHTMYEGRARRFPSGAQRREVIRRDRRCRFPGCPNATFVRVHHLEEWKPGGGTDLPNLVLLCRHHHGVVHRNGWSMTGNANEELTITGPTGRVTVSRPSLLWARATDHLRSDTFA